MPLFTQTRISVQCDTEIDFFIYLSILKMLIIPAVSLNKQWWHVHVCISCPVGAGKHDGCVTGP